MHLERDVSRYTSSAWKIGGLPEASVADTLGELDQRVWTVRHQVSIAPGVSVDHVVAGPCGVFVIDSKIRSGEVRVGRAGIRINDHDTSLLANALEAARVIHGLLHRSAWVTPVLVFDRGMEVDEEPDRVMVVTAES